MAPEDIEFEVTSVTTPANSVLRHEETAEERIQQEIKRFSLPDQKIAEMQAQFGGLKIRLLPAPEDKAEMKLYRDEKEEVRKALQIVRSVRTGLENKRKELKSDYLKIGKGIDGEAARLTALVTPIEQPLQESFNAAEQAEEDRKNEAERIAQQRLQTRVHDLIAAGIQFDGNFYSIGDISVDVLTLKQLRDEQFSDLLSKVQGIKAAKDEEARLEAERIAEEKRKEEADRIELKRQQDELRKQQDDLKRQQDELKAAQDKARETAIQNRRTAIESLGLVWSSYNQLYCFECQSGRVTVPIAELLESSDDQWQTIQTNVAGLVKEAKDKEAQRVQEENEAKIQQARITNLRNERVQQLQLIGFTANPGEDVVQFLRFGEQPLNISTKFLGEMTVEAWKAEFERCEKMSIDIENAYQIEKAKREAQLEADRKAAMKESELVAEYFAKVNAIERPTITDPALKSKVEYFFIKLDALIADFK